MLEKGAEDSVIGIGQRAVGVTDQPSLRGGGIGGDVGPRGPLAALDAVDVQFGDVDRQPERLHLGQGLIHRLERGRDIEVGLRADGMDGDALIPQGPDHPVVLRRDLMELSPVERLIPVYKVVTSPSGCARRDLPVDGHADGEVVAEGLR
jgi:hypothetical protein